MYKYLDYGDFSYKHLLKHCPECPRHLEPDLYMYKIINNNK